MKSINIQWNQLHHNFLDQKIYLPTYSFQKQRYWLDPDSKFLYKNKPQIYAPSWSYQPISIISQQTMELKSHLNNNLIIFLSPNEFSNNFLSILKKMGITPNIIEANSIFYKKEPNYYLIDPGNKKHYSLAFENIKFDSETIIIHLFSSITYEADIQNENEIEHELNLSFYSFLYGLQAYVESDLASTSLKYALITTGTYKIIGNETIHPVNASLLGAMRVAQLEHTNFKFKFFDLELTGLSEKSDTYISSIIDSCLYGHWGNNTPIVAYRHLSQYELDYVPIKNSKIMSRFSENGVYLITGGLGGVAFYLCKAIASRVKNPTFILVSRTPIIEPSQWPSILSYPSHVDYTKINRLKTLESLGATVYWDAIDITDLESVTQLVNQYKTRCNGINGVIHAAGIAGDGLLQFKSKTKSEPIFKSKLFSAYILARALEGLELDFVVLMSSIAALTGEIGQIDYSAANASLDALAVSNLFSSKFTVSINWNTWKNIGMAADSKRPIDVNYTERGNYISPKQGEKLFFKIMENTYSNVAISNYGLEQYRLNLIQGDKHSLEPNIKTQREQLNISTDYNEPQNSTEKKLVQLWQDNLGIDRIGIYDDFFAMGGHSLKALKLIDTINKIFNSKISIQHLYKHPTIYELAKHIDFNNNVDIGIVVSLKKAQTKAPTIFCCHPISGMIYCFESLISNWQTPINIYGLQDPSISCDILKYKNIISMAKSYLKAIKEIQPKGPYNFLGYSFGGTLLYEIGHLLQKNNEKVNLLALIDGWCVFSDKQKNEDYFKKEFKISHKNLSDNLINLSWARMKLLFKHIPTKTNQDLILFKATELLNDYKTIDHPSNGWSNHTTGKILNYEIKANHHTIINKENILNIIKILDL